MKDFVLYADNLKLIRSSGVGIYPFPTKLFGNTLANLWKSASHTPVLLLRKEKNNHEYRSWNKSILEMNQQTVF